MIKVSQSSNCNFCIDPNSGLGVCITSQNYILDGNFSQGVLLEGKACIMYPNGEYYEGDILYGGTKHGKGILFYKNSKVSYTSLSHTIVSCI